jgi:hypothetical protein
MGRQQLFIITVIIFLFLAAAYGSIVALKSYSETSNRDQIISTLYDIGLSAQKYYKKNHTEHDGNSFSGWELSTQYNRTDAATFNAIVRQKKVNLCANGNQTGMNGSTQVRVTASVDSSSIKITVIN